MSSPFPGMNPYLEQDHVWQDFHQSAIPVMRELLIGQVRPNYLVKIDEFLFIHELPDSDRRLLGRGDVTIGPARPAAQTERGGSVLTAPDHGQVPVGIDFERHSFLEIRDRLGQHLIAVIEMLSPSNKQPGPDREQYLAKRRQLFASAVHLVEIDLLRGRPRMPVEGLAQCDYCVMVSRFEDRPRVGLWPIGLRDRLPVIPIPLRSPDGDARLDLQLVLDRVYDAAGYEDYLYSTAPQPPLRPEDDAWARQFIPGKK